MAERENRNRSSSSLSSALTQLSPGEVPACRRYSSPEEFLKDCSGFLCQNEAENNLILGVAGSLGSSSSPYDDFYLASVSGREIEGVFMMTPPYNLVVSFPASERAMSAALEDLAADGRKVPGVIGAAGIADAFAEAWARMTGGRSTIATNLICYRLETVSDIVRASGTFRRASLDDLDLMADWAEGFARDTQHPQGVDNARARLEGGVLEEQFFIWEDHKRPVSILRATGTTPRGVRISFVYTPPEHRGRGYASSLTAEVSALKLSEGRKFCFLFTDAANPTSNKIYKLIGYREVCNFREYTFCL